MPLRLEHEQSLPTTRKHPPPIPLIPQTQDKHSAPVPINPTTPQQSIIIPDNKLNKLKKKC